MLQAATNSLICSMQLDLDTDSTDEMWWDDEAAGDISHIAGQK